MKGNFSMIGHRKQVRNLIFFLVLVLYANPSAQARDGLNPGGSMIDPSGANGAGGNKVFSVGEIFGGMKHVIGRMVPTWPAQDEEEDQPVTPAANQESKGTPSQPSASQPAANDTQMIKTHRLDEATDKTKQAAPTSPDQAKAETPAPAPYKVYTAPMIPEDTAPTPHTDTIEVYQPAATRTPDAQVARQPVVDTKAPPPLSDDYLKANLEKIIVNPPLPGAQAPAEAPVTRRDPVRQTAGYSMEDAAASAQLGALPKQFFPIFPFDASPDAQEQLLPIASNRALEEDMGDITRAIIVIHDISRNSFEGIATLATLAGSGGEPTLILSPHFSLDIDIARFEKYLPDGGQKVSRWTLDDPWQFGGESVLPLSRRGITSFTAMDILLLFLDDHARFPSLRQIVIAGHGLGADFVQRYAALGVAPDVLAKDRMPVRFVVANPSTLLYTTHTRPTDTGRRFTNPDMKACPKLDDYPYGLQKLPAYAKRTGINAVKMRYPKRNVVYLAGDKITSDNFLTRGCEAMAEGRTRTERSKNYAAFIEQSYGDGATGQQSFALVKGAGYDPLAVFGSSCGMKALFGDGQCR